jgi:diaminohydroxyphosphoribosylaminopyrimidine deaminase/5-amino-6-(5-phosphoribosylamino)uracil reductase
LLNVDVQIMIEKDEKYMRRCFQLAQLGRGHVAPNPMVGAVIVCDGRIIGEGYHRQWGGPHAEVNAIASVRQPQLLSRSTMYVSLEPCSHYGKTPPCAKLLIDKHIPRVVVANVDPFPEVSGRGLRMLREAGAEVESGFLASEGWEVNRRFFTFQTQHRPYILLKWAQSADGYMARTDGQPLLISSTLTQPLVHLLRAGEQAIMVGTRTALADNPQLTVRQVSGRDPLRILVDRDLQLPRSAHLYDGVAPTLVFTRQLPAEESVLPNVELVQAPFTPSGLRLDFLMEQLYARQVQSLIVEGGSALLQSFVAAGLFDEMRVETNQRLVLGQGIAAPRVQGRCAQSVQVGHHLITRFRQPSPMV